MPLDLAPIQARNAYLHEHRLSAPESEATVRMQIREDIPALLETIERLRETLRRSGPTPLKWPA